MDRGTDAFVDRIAMLGWQLIQSLADCGGLEAGNMNIDKVRIQAAGAGRRAS